MRKFFRLVVSLVAVLALYFVWSSRIIEKNLNFSDIQKNLKEVYEENTKKEFPTLEGEKKADFSWEYQGKTFALSLSLFDSVYKFYQESPKEYAYYKELPTNWEEEYYEMFLKKEEKDDTIPVLASKIKDLAKKNKFSFDEEIELALAFVQSIPYDEEKARNIEQNTKEEKPNYPYEVLFENKGVCSGKSFLAYALIRELGYGVNLFEYKDQKHIALGIQCDKNYSTYNSGYCYAETTKSGHKIGIVPDIEAGTNAAVSKREIKSFGLEDENNKNTTKLGEVAIFNQKTGKTYQRIVETFKTKDRIELLEKEIASLKNSLVPLQASLKPKNNEMEDLQGKMEKLKKNKEFEKYNSLVPQYNELIASYKKEIATYNQKIDIYNKKVAEYNSLIKDFYK